MNYGITVQTSRTSEVRNHYHSSGRRDYGDGRSDNPQRHAEKQHEIPCHTMLAGSGIRSPSHPGRCSTFVVISHFAH